MHAVNRARIRQVARIKTNWLEIYPFLRGLARVGKESLIERVRGPALQRPAAHGRKSGVLPFEANTDFFASFFSGQNRQRRRAFGQRALAGIEIVTITMIVAANLAAIEKLAGGF